MATRASASCLAGGQGWLAQLCAGHTAFRVPTCKFGRHHSLIAFLLAPWLFSLDILFSLVSVTASVTDIPTSNVRKNKPEMHHYLSSPFGKHRFFVPLCMCWEGTFTRNEMLAPLWFRLEQAEWGEGSLKTEGLTTFLRVSQHAYQGGRIWKLL